MKYTVKWCEKKTSKNGPYLKLDIQGEGNVSVWPDKNPSWQNIHPGVVIEGIIKESNGYKNFEEMDENANGVAISAPNRGFYNPTGGKGAQIAQAQETRRRDVEMAQAQKEESVKQASTFRDATLLTVAELGTGAGDEQIRETWLRWRNFLLKNWELNEPF